jgi:hypothetical protein
MSSFLSSKPALESRYQPCENMDWLILDDDDDEPPELSVFEAQAAMRPCLCRLRHRGPCTVNRWPMISWKAAVLMVNVVITRKEIKSGFPHLERFMLPCVFGLLGAPV